MGNKGRKNGSRTERLIIGGFIATVLLVIGGFYLSTKAPQAATVTGNVVSGADNQAADIGGLITATVCSGDANPTVRTIGTNPLDTIATDYTKGAIGHFRQKSSPLVQLDVTYAGATQATNANGICGKTYDLVVETFRDYTNGLYLATPFDGGKDVLPAGGETATVEVTNVTLLQVRLKDVFQDAYMYKSIGSANKDFVAMGSSVTFMSVTNNATATNIAAGEGNKVHFIAEIEGINKYGEFGMQSYACVDRADDSNAQDFQVADFFKANGVSLAEMKGQLKGDDNSQLVAYEDCYKLPQTLGKGNTDTIDMKFPTGSGVNPDKDITVRVLGTGIKESSEKTNTYLGLIELDGNNMFDDSASYIEIVTATPQQFTISID